MIKCISLTQEAVEYVDKIAKKFGKNKFSHALELIIHQHKGYSEEEVKLKNSIMEFKDFKETIFGENVGENGK